MVNILAFALVILIAVLCSGLALFNLLSRRRSRKTVGESPANLESLKKQGLISQKELEFLQEGKSQLQELPVESCTLSSEEVMEVMEAAIESVNDLNADKSYAANEKWAGAFGIKSPLTLNLKELVVLSMKMDKPRSGLEILAEILAMNISIDALEAAQNSGKSAFPNYKAMARVVWVRVKERFAEPIATMKELHEQRKQSGQWLVVDLMLMIMKSLRVPVSAAGFVVILALMIAKTEFNAFSEEEDKPGQRYAS